MKTFSPTGNENLYVINVISASDTYFSPRFQQVLPSLPPMVCLWYVRAPAPRVAYTPGTSAAIWILSRWLGTALMFMYGWSPWMQIAMTSCCNIVRKLRMIAVSGFFVSVFSLRKCMLIHTHLQFDILIPLATYLQAFLWFCMNTLAFYLEQYFWVSSVAFHLFRGDVFFDHYRALRKIRNSKL